jgi:DNA-binding PadR family transcriptional regulator
VAELDEPVGLEERINELQRQIDEMMRQQREEQVRRREAIKDQVSEMRSLQADERQERKKAVQAQIDEIRQLHKEQQERQKALLEEMGEMKRLERAERKEKKALRPGLALKLGKTGDDGARAKEMESLQDHGDIEVRKGFLRLHILGVLAEGPSHGYEIMHRIGSHTGDMWKPSPGSMYPALETLDSKGFIACQGDGRRKVYTLTPKGQKVLDEIRKKRDEQFYEMKAFMAALFEE